MHKQKFKNMVEAAIENLTCTRPIREALLKALKEAENATLETLLSGIAHGGLKNIEGLAEYLSSVLDVPPISRIREKNKEEGNLQDDPCTCRAS